MGTILLIIQIITSIPKIIGLVMDIIKMLKQIKDPTERKLAMDELRREVKRAKKTGDTSGVEALYVKHVGDRS